MAKRISAEEFDRIFDEGNEGYRDYLDLDKAVVSYPDLDTDLRRVNVDFPRVDDRRAGSRGQKGRHQPPGGHQDLDRRPHRPYARRPLGVGEVVGRIVVDSLEARETVTELR